MKIENRKYSGYVWMSDEAKPCVILHDEEYGIEIDETANPFIVEAQLYCAAERLSISVKYVDGQYIVREYSDVGVDSANDDAIELKQYLGNPRMGKETLNFLQYWEESAPVEMSNGKDLLCGMRELRPGKFVFVGFKD